MGGAGDTQEVKSVSGMVSMSCENSDGGGRFFCCYVPFGNADTPTFCSCNDLLHCDLSLPLVPHVFFHDRVPSVAALASIDINTVLAYDMPMTILQLCAIILTNDLALNVQERAFIQVSQ